MESTIPENGIYSEITDSIRVSVYPEHSKQESSPEEHKYCFEYTVSIENLSSTSVQLIERYWIITSAGLKFAELIGPGVGGVEPVIEPGEIYEYTSTAVIEDPVGSMRGQYTLRSSEGRFFDVFIPQFDLLYPLIIH